MMLSEGNLPEALDDLVAAHPPFAAVRAAAGAVERRGIDPGFAGLAWVVSGQQISVAAASAIFARMEQELGGVTAPSLLAATDAQLRRAGQSAGKIRTLRAAAAAVRDGGLDLAAVTAAPSAEGIAALTRLPGIGPWTAESFLLLAGGHRDVFPAADVALQEAARMAFGLPVRPGTKDLLALAEAWRPHRGVAALLLWAYYLADRAARRAAVKSG